MILNKKEFFYFELLARFLLRQDFDLCLKQKVTVPCKQKDDSIPVLNDKCILDLFRNELKVQDH